MRQNVVFVGVECERSTLLKASMPARCPTSPPLPSSRSVLRLGKDERLDFLFPATPDEPALTGPAAFPLKLAGFWLAQGAWAWVCLLPVTACHALAATTPMGPAAWAAAAAAAGCLWVEAEADTQKAAFRADPANAGTFLDTGLYSVVRYPNYAGEIGVWTFLTALAGSTTLTAAPWVVASPVGAAGLLLCVSGVPPLQKAHERRYGHLPAWRDYVEATPAILPRLPARWFGGRKKA